MAAPNQKAFTAELINQIQEINGNHKLAPWQKKEAIANLKGAPRQEMFDYVLANYRTGPGLAEALSTHVSEGRPRGAPEDSAKGTKKVKKN